jgi:hypothetical protein
MKFGVAVEANHTNFHIDELLYKRGQSRLALLAIRIQGRGRNMAEYSFGATWREDLLLFLKDFLNLPKN